MQSRSRLAAWPALLSYLCAFVVLIVADSVLLAAVGRLRASDRRDVTSFEAQRFAASAQGAMAVAATNAAVLLLVAFAFARLQGSVRTGLRIRRSNASAMGSIAAIFGTIGLSVAGGAASDFLGVGRSGVMGMLETALAGADPTTLALALAAIAVAPAVGEETFFRGAMQTRLAAAYGRWPAIVVASLAFGLLHLDLVQGTLAFFIGLFLGWCAERFDGIRPTIVAHAANNAVFILLAATCRSGGVSRGSEAAAAAFGITLWALCAGALRSRFAVEG
ncbi:MAG TPA: type II CAAX endopeptidase family protein [Polyangiaceae bacterium]|nr:type II CAAX endopeptidase family protein [Polyangiaceae bacterium]